MNEAQVQLEDAAEILEQPIEGGDHRNHVVRKEVGNGNRIEVRRFSLFDPSGLEMSLYGDGAERPFIKARAFSRDRFRRILEWFHYLSERPDAMRSETRLALVVEEFARRSPRHRV